MKLNYERIITIEEMESSNIDEAIDASNFEYNRIKGLGFFLISNKLAQRADELLKTNQYFEYNKIQKEIFKANFIYNNDDRIIEILLSLKVNYENLEGIMKLIQTFKILHEADPKSPIFNDTIFKSTTELLEKLCLILQRELKCDDEVVTINKLTYLVSFKKELYLNKQNGPVK